MAADLPRTRLGASARIGLVADTHCHAPGATDLPDAVLDALRGVDLVLHLGDAGDAAVLDRLESLAPVVATRGRDDVASDARIAPTQRLVDAGGLVVGAMFDLRDVGLATGEEDRFALSADVAPERVFGRQVDVVAFGGTHAPLVAHHRGVLFVHPGSATLPGRADAGRTVGVLTLRDRVASVEVIRI